MLSIQPDRRWLTKQYLVLATVTITLLITAGIIHLIIRAATDPGDDVGGGLVVLWLVTAGLVVAVWAVAVPIIVLWFNRLDYAVEDDKITIRKGILTKIQQGIPLRMITDFRLQRTLYDRALGIGSIQIQTAGQSQAATGYEGKLAGLADWATLHEELRTRLRPDVRSPSLSDPDQPADPLVAILDEVRAIRERLERP